MARRRSVLPPRPRSRTRALVAGSTHTYTVDAVDAATNASAKSQASLSITVATATDTIAPSVPGRPAGTSPSAGTIQISWAASTDPAPASLPITYRDLPRRRRDLGRVVHHDLVHRHGRRPGCRFEPHLHGRCGRRGDQCQRQEPGVAWRSPWRRRRRRHAAGARAHQARLRRSSDQLAARSPPVRSPTSSTSATASSSPARSPRSGTTPAANTTSYNQPSLAAFNIDTGLVDANFRPTFGGGGVTEVEASPDGTKLFVVGTVQHRQRRHEAQGRFAQPDDGRGEHGLHRGRERGGDLRRGDRTPRSTSAASSRRSTAPPASSLAAVNATTGAIVTGLRQQPHRGHRRQRRPVRAGARAHPRRHASCSSCTPARRSPARTATAWA